MAEQECFFDDFFGAAKQVLEAAKKPQIKKGMQRKLQSAYDDAENKKIDEESKIEQERLKFKEYDVMVVLQSQRTIEMLNLMQEKIRKEYLFLFGEEMK
jgi:hypothetical protein